MVVKRHGHNGLLTAAEQVVVEVPSWWQVPAPGHSIGFIQVLRYVDQRQGLVWLVFLFGQAEADLNHFVHGAGAVVARAVDDRVHGVEVVDQLVPRLVPG